MRIQDSVLSFMSKAIFAIGALFIPLLANSEDLATKAEQAFYAGDLIVAKNYYAELAQTEDPNAHYYLGLIDKMSSAKQQNNKNMLAHFKKAASLGHSLAMWELGIAYEAGDGVGQNQFIAMDWFRKSEQHSTPPDDSVFFITGSDGTLTEYQPAKYFEHLLLKAQAGDTDSQFIVATLYDKGHLTSVDRSAAFKWYLTAAQSGHIRAAYITSYFYCRGIVGDKDLETAEYWAAKGNLITKCED